MNLTKLIKLLQENMTPDDAAFMSAVESGDATILQKMVDYAAKSKGYTLETWRGETNEEDHSDFSRRRETGIFTSQNKDFAAQYATHAGSRKSRGEPRRFYVKANRILDLESPDRAAHQWMDEWGKNWADDGWIDRGSGEEVEVSDLIAGGTLYDYEGDWSGTRWSDLQKSARADGYDVLIAPDAGDGDDTTSTIILNPKHIKLARAITRDDDEQIIPISQRFNSESTDVRF